MKDDANFYKVFGLSLNTSKKDNESKCNLNNNDIDNGKNKNRQLDDITITNSNSIIKVNNSSIDKRKEIYSVSNINNNDDNIYNNIYHKEYFNNTIKKSEYFNIILLQRPVYSDIQDFSNNRIINSINNSTIVKTNNNSKNSSNNNTNSTITLKNEVINIEKTKRENYYYFIKHKLLDNSLEFLKQDNSSKDINHSINNKHIKIDNLCLLDFHSLQDHYSSKSTITKEIYNLNFDNINFLSDMSLLGELSFLETICAHCIYIPFNRKDISFNKENFTENSRILNPYGLNSKVNSHIEINNNNTDSKYKKNDSESTVNNLISISYETIFQWSEITEYNDSLVEATYKEISQKINNVIKNLNSSNTSNSNDDVVYSILLFIHFVFEEEDDWDKFLNGFDINKKYHEYRNKEEESLRKALETKIHVFCNEIGNNHSGEEKSVCYFCSFLVKLIDVYFYLYQIKDYYFSYNLVLMNKVSSVKGRFNNNNNNNKKILASVISSGFNSFVDYAISLFIKKYYDSKYDYIMCKCGVNKERNNDEDIDNNRNSSNRRNNKNNFNLDFDNNDDIIIKNTNSGSSNNNKLDTRNHNINSNNDIIINSLKDILKYIDSLKFSYSEINRNENNPVIFFDSKFGINIINKNTNNTFNMELKNFLNREILYTTPSEYIEFTIKNKDYSKNEFNRNELQSINIHSI